MRLTDRMRGKVEFILRESVAVALSANLKTCVEREQRRSFIDVFSRVFYFYLQWKMTASRGCHGD